MSESRVQSIEVVHWNPRRNSLPYPLSRLPVGRRVNNFGDLLGPMIVKRMLEASGAGPGSATEARRLLSVGSIMGLARDGDVVWGSGVNGKLPSSVHKFTRLDVRAVRGPRTRAFLVDMGVACPIVFGDPALLLPELFPEMREWTSNKTRDIGILPNFHDLASVRHEPGCISPIGSPEAVIRELLASERLIASSLHGIIIAEAFGIPVVPLASGVEHPFKYLDYYEGTGREAPEVPSTVVGARSQFNGGLAESIADSWCSEPLRRAFPFDLWGSAGEMADVQEGK